jgi:hypothetical protein
MNQEEPKKKAGLKQFIKNLIDKMDEKIEAKAKSAPCCPPKKSSKGGSCCG